MSRLRSWYRKHHLEIILAMLSASALLIFLLPSIVVLIKPGEAGVLWSLFFGGTVTTDSGHQEFQGRIEADAEGNPELLQERGHEWTGGGDKYPYREGLRFKWPWDKMFIYDIRLQLVSHEYDVLADGLDLRATISTRWKPIEADLGKLHRDIGPDYVEKLIIPIVGSHARELIGNLTPEQVYATERLNLQRDILARVKEEMKANFYPEDRRESFIIVEDILIRSIVLPEEVRDAIREKNEQKYLADAYVFRLDRERQEAERKAIEAQGIQAFQETIQGSISDRYLQWKGIDATLELARSNNAKIVVIGAGDDGLPIILGGLDQPGGLTLPSTSSSGANRSTPGVVPPRPQQPNAPPSQ